jgi:hypothetical protein
MASQADPIAWGPWPDRVRLPLRFEADALAADLAQVEDDSWTRHFVRDNYEGDWTVVPLRAPKGETHPIRMICAGYFPDGFVDTPLLARCPAFAATLASLRSPINAARLMRLAPGSVIREHRDLDLSAEDGLARLHIPIRTSPEVDFRVAGTPVAMEPASLWYLRLSEPHSVHNRGTAARVHLVVDAVMNDWLAALLDAGTALQPER